MFTDTHIHLSHLYSSGIDCTKLFRELVEKKFCFVQDVGTKCDDIESRMEIAFSSIEKIDDVQIKENAEKIIYFSAGIWPSVDAIDNKEQQVADLIFRVKNILKNEKLKDKLIAIGECGLDHHRQVHSETEESELFEMQLDFAKVLKLPVIIHTRDAFDATLNCIKNMNYHNGEIHCFSYGKSEAKAFLDLGWYIALGGAVTYAKKANLEDIKELIRYIPKDRLLLETDSPYLTPVPFRGKINTPLFILHTYQFIADILCMDITSLAQICLENANRLFFYDKNKK
ncbi:MAG: TatD family hydrolase [Treponemataceae bacterium]